MSDKRPEPMDPYEFMRQLHKTHYMYKIKEELDMLDHIDNVVNMMDEYPEADHLIFKIQRRLRNDDNF
jgi:hypothetical protein